MFNGHMDTSYSGREPWLAGRARLPAERVRAGRPALRARHLEHEGRARLLRRGGARASGRGRAAGAATCSIAAVCGEIEKAQWGDAQGAEYRGYAAGIALPRLARRRRRHVHPRRADRGRSSCSATSARSGCGSRPQGNFIHTAFSEGKRDQNSILRMREVLDAVLEWIPTWEGDPENAYRGAPAIVNVGAIQGGFGWRVSRTPHRTDLFLDVRVPPTKPMATARAQVLDMVRGLAARFPDVRRRGRGLRHRSRRRDRRGPPADRRARRGARARCSARPRSSDVTRWFSDASALTRARHRRPSTTARRPACSTRPTARTSTSRGS